MATWSREDYTNVDGTLKSDTPKNTFQVDNYDVKKWRILPKSWMDKTGTKFLHPPNSPNYEKWSEGIFDRNFFPQSTWIEEPIGMLEMQSFSKFQLKPLHRQDIC
jgi:hypothetical protein